jgi:hypothetical protein
MNPIKDKDQIRQILSTTIQVITLGFLQIHRLNLLVFYKEIKIVMISYKGLHPINMTN